MRPGPFFITTYNIALSHNVDGLGTFLEWFDISFITPGRITREDNFTSPGPGL